MTLRNSIAGKNAIVSGGSFGIGKAITEALRNAGSSVVYADKNPPNSTDQEGFLPVDLTNPIEIAAFYKKCMENVGAPDVLVLNAGQGIQQRLDEGDADQWEYIMKLNMMSPLRLLNLFLPEMKKKDFADVVIISSVSAFHPYQTGAVYSATKTALNNISEVLRLENMPQIRVTTIAPGVVNTNFFENNIDGESDVESLGMGYVEPSEIADAVIYAITRRKEIAVNYMVIRPTKQEM